MRTIGVVTGGRAEYGILRPLLRAIQRSGTMRLSVLVTGMHLSSEFGLTLREIEADGFPIDERVEMLSPSDEPEAIAQSMGRGTMGFAEVFARRRPDILVALGDRYEIHAAVLAALPFLIPVAHIHGGESTEGAFDNALRHSMTMLSHLHFVSTEAYGKRVIGMGEEPWRVVVSGALGLDNLHGTTLMSRTELEAKVGLSLVPAPIIVTFHPTTLEYEQADDQAQELLAALDQIDRPIVFTMPNADTGGRRIRSRIQDFVKTHPNTRAVENLGTQAYFSLMRVAGVMAGNSSSGIIEAMSFALPVVNVGTRQAGRFRPENVIDVDYRRNAILDGLRRALRPETKAGLIGRENPYGDGSAAPRILRKLETVPLDDRLLRKRFGEPVPMGEESEHGR